MNPSTESRSDSSISGKRVAFVGKLGGVTRKVAASIAREQGAVPVSIDEANIDLVIVGADESPDQSDSWQIKLATLFEDRESKPEIINESQWWELMGQGDSEGALHSLHTPAMLADLLGLPVPTIRQWYRRGLIRACKLVHNLPYFDFQEIAVARKLAEMTAAGVSAARLEKRLSELKRQVPDVQRPLHELNVMIEGSELLVKLDGVLEQFDGQKRIDFQTFENSTQDGFDDASPAIPIRSAQDHLDGLQTADEYMELANDLEEANEVASAIEVYRALQLAFGPSAEIHFRLGEMLYMTGQVQAARERYYAAIELDESYVEARASLGCVLVELGQYELAIAAFEGVLEYHEDYPDVHFHLAAALDATGRSEQAHWHWQRFVELAPDSPWVAEATHRLEP